MNNTVEKILRLAVLGSTRGTDLQALLDAQTAGTLAPAEIVVVVSNKPKSYILERARQAGVAVVAIPSKGRSQSEFEQEMLTVLQQHQVDYILLIGFMKVLSADFVAKYPMKILNIHPSLLPKYAGGMNLDVHAEVLKNHETETGCTLHYVTADVDVGPIFAQAKVPVLVNDTPETLKQRVQQAEQELLLKAVQLLADDQLPETSNSDTVAP